MAKQSNLDKEIARVKLDIEKLQAILLTLLDLQNKNAKSPKRTPGGTSKKARKEKTPADGSLL